MDDSTITYLADGTPVPSGGLDTASLAELWAAYPELAAVLVVAVALLLAVRHPASGDLG